MYQDPFAARLEVGENLHHTDSLVKMAAKSCCLLLVKMMLHQMGILVQVAAKHCCLLLPIMKFVCVIMISVTNK